MLGMTGYSFNEIYNETVHISTELKSVNHRFLDINLSMPYYLNSLEIQIRELIQKRIKRGKVDVSVSLKLNESSKDIQVDMKLAGLYAEALKSIINEFQIKDELKLTHLTRYDDIIRSEKRKDYSSYWDVVELSLNKNLDDIILMKKNEGTTTYKDLSFIADKILTNVIIIESKLPEMEKKIFENMKQKVSELVGDKIDESRLLNEVAILVSRSCINEEIERLKMHVEQFLSIASESEDVGKRLDFVCQEMHREINTIGSKITLSELTGNVIIVKNEIEKLREQIRNIE